MAKCEIGIKNIENALERLKNGWGKNILKKTSFYETQRGIYISPKQGVRMKIKEVMNQVKRSYERNLANTYPSWGHLGFVERNQTFNFCSQYEKLFNNPKLSIWQEVNLNETREHMDSLIVDGDTAYLIEAKRLQSEKSVKAIEEDMVRMEKIVKKSAESEDGVLCGLKHAKKIVYVILADFWLPRQKGRAKKLAHRESFDMLCQKYDYKTIFSEEILAGGTAPVSDAEEYHLICVMKS